MTEVHARTVALADEVFLDIVPRIEDVAELKLVLQVAYRGALSNRLAVPLDDLTDARQVHLILNALSPEPAQERLRRLVDRAVANGTLLRVAVRREGRSREYLIVPTVEGRALLDRIQAGDVTPDADSFWDTAEEVVVYRPNVFALYEQHIGPLTPLVAEHLRDAERLFPRGWVEQAILTAVHYNKRNWRYINAVLSNWEDTEGSHGISKRGS